jgi:hypothetical protein
MCQETADEWAVGGGREKIDDGLLRFPACGSRISHKRPPSPGRFISEWTRAAGGGGKGRRKYLRV